MMDVPNSKKTVEGASRRVDGFKRGDFLDLNPQAHPYTSFPSRGGVGLKRLRMASAYLYDRNTIAGYDVDTMSS
jgi:hypothetical protein